MHPPFLIPDGLDGFGGNRCQGTGEVGLAEAGEPVLSLGAGVGSDVGERLRLGSMAPAPAVTAARAGRHAWQDMLAGLLDRVDFLVTPTLTIFPPTLESARELLVARCTIPVNLAGVPALVLPVPTTGRLPASIQLIGPAQSEERLLAAGAWLESAVAAAG